MADEVSQILERIDALIDFLKGRNLNDHAATVTKLATNLADTNRDISFELRKRA